MNTIWHYPLDITHYQTVTVPVGIELLKIGFEGDQLMIWGLLDPQVTQRVTVAIRMFLTGHSWDPPPHKTNPTRRAWRYLDSVTTCQQETWHVFIEL